MVDIDREGSMQAHDAGVPVEKVKCPTCRISWGRVRPRACGCVPRLGGRVPKLGGRGVTWTEKT